MYLFSEESGVGALLDECDTQLPPGEVRGGSVCLLRRTETNLCEGHPQQGLVWAWAVTGDYGVEQVTVPSKPGCRGIGHSAAPPNLGARDR